MKLSLAEVEHVADLARLALTAAEKDRFREQLSSILAYAERLQEADTTGIPPTAVVLPLSNILRDDEAQPSLPIEDVLANAPAVEERLFRVPVVLEDQE